MVLKRFGVMWSASVAVMMVACGCSGFGDFSFDSESQEALVKGQTSALPVALPVEGILPPLTIDFDLKSQLEQRDADGANGVYLTALVLQVTPTARPQGDQDDFSFLESVEVFVESSKQGSTLGRQRIAQLPKRPAKGKDQVSFKVESGVNLKPYVEEGVTLTTTGKGAAPEDDVTFKAVTTLEVEVF